MAQSSPNLLVKEKMIMVSFSRSFGYKNEKQNLMIMVSISGNFGYKNEKQTE